MVAALARGEAPVSLGDLALASTAEMERVGRLVLAELSAESAADPPPPRAAVLPAIRTGTHLAPLRASATEPALLAIAQHHIGGAAVFQGVHAPGRRHAGFSTPPKPAGPCWQRGNASKTPA